MALDGSALLTVSTLAFALAPDASCSSVARDAAGLAAGITWAASMAWLSANTPRDRLPRESGIVMGLFSTGAVIGPGRRLLRPCHLSPARVLVPGGRRRAHDPARPARAAPASRSRPSAATWAPSDRAPQPPRAGRHHALGDRPGITGRDRPARATPPALARRADLAHRRRADDRRRARRDLRARSRAGGPSASARCAWASSPRPSLVVLPDVTRRRAFRPAQLLLLVAVAPGFTIIATAMYPLSTRGATSAASARRRQRRALGDLGDRLCDSSLAAGVLADRHGDTATYAIVASVCASLLAALAFVARRPRHPIARDLSSPAGPCSPEVRHPVSVEHTALSAASALKPRRPSSPSRCGRSAPAPVARRAARAPPPPPGLGGAHPGASAASPTASRSRSASTRPGPQPGRESLLGERERQRLVVDVAQPLEIVEHGLADVGRARRREPRRERRARERPARQRLAGCVERSLAYVVHLAAYALGRRALGVADAGRDRDAVGRRLGLRTPAAGGTSAATSPSARPGGGTVAPGMIEPSETAWMRLRMRRSHIRVLAQEGLGLLAALADALLLEREERAALLHDAPSRGRRPAPCPPRRCRGRR